MPILISGLVLFFLVHIVPSTSLKASLQNNVGEVRYKIGFSLFSLLGLGLIIYGFSQSSFEPLWSPPRWGRTMLFSIMPVVCILWVVAEVPNNIRRVVRHPMLTAMLLWGGGHLVANGDLASSLIFASFAVFSVVNILVVNKRQDFSPREPVGRMWDVGVVVGGLFLYALIFKFHGVITGMPLF